MANKNMGAHIRISSMGVSEMGYIGISPNTAASDFHFGKMMRNHWRGAMRHPIFRQNHRAGGS